MSHYPGSESGPRRYIGLIRHNDAGIVVPVTRIPA
jgi:hypothetical protein